ncbi:MAG: hypothetical protein IKW96_11195 [Ruminococcus sp.]|uniref:hypothetical protein n=1 Tax=Ruminococcus sp. TaxID=41978 RepID=UPI0025E6F457|nr:hypothetical protein [Ruminococcus sp.]MBR5683816.1 hypothetical protein [Ruminococcus sp.]
MNIYQSKDRNRSLCCEERGKECLFDKEKKISCNIFVDLHENALQSESGLYRQYGGIVCKFRLNELILGVLRGVLPYNDDFFA